MNKINLVYFGHVKIPSIRAYAVHVMHMCDAFSKNCNVQLISLGGKKIKLDRIRESYNVSSRFKIRLLSIPPIYFLESFLYVFNGYLRYVIKNKIDIIYSRDLLATYIGGLLGYKTVFEAHMPIKKQLHHLLFKRLINSKNFKLVCISNNLSNKFKIDYPDLDLNKIKVFPDGANIQIVNNSFRTQELHKNFFNFGYVGNLYSGKGMEIIVPLSKLLPNKTFHIIGGREIDIKYWKEQCNENVIFHGFVNQSKLSELYDLFGIALMPLQQKISPDGGTSNIAEYTSPMKMFEYIAYQKLIISSNLPVLLEILKHNFNSIIVNSNDIDDWYKALSSIDILDKAKIRKIINNAYNDLIVSYSWDQRANKILNWIN